VLALIGFGAWRDQRRQRPAVAEPAPEPQRPESPAKYSDRR
jgi:hypothetical protein